MLLGKVRFIPFSYHSPYENMAIDEFCLNDFLENGIPYFRVYGWRPAGLSIGVNQLITTIDTDACLKDSLPVVRRMTGGGAILHDNELTYSLVIPASAVGEKTGVAESFEAVTVFLHAMYSSLGLSARYAKDAFPDIKHGQRSSFCFASSEKYDTIIMGRKIGGNAQARRKNAIFQHGSIPITLSDGERYTEKSSSTVEYTSLSDLLQQNPGVENLAFILADAFAQSCGAEFIEHQFSLAEKKKIVSLMTTKYGNALWNFSGKN